MKFVGLTSEEAVRRFSHSGANEIVQKRRETRFKIFLSQFKNIFVLILLSASGVSFFVKDFLDAVAILVIIVLNALFGFFQEYRAEKALEALSSNLTESVRVLRDQIEKEIPSRLLVVGDVVILEEGKKVPADLKLLESVNLQVNEATLTGESFPVSKDIFGKTNEETHLFASTIITTGRGVGEVLATGMETRFGKIASLVETTGDDPSPLELQLSTLGKELAVVGIISGLVLFLIGFTFSTNLYRLVLTSITLAVAVVPEGLPAVITITLAIGLQRMSRRNAIVRKLTAIETLGSVDVICTDKTGTLTKNEMKVKNVYLEKTLEASDKSLNEHNTHFARFLKVAYLCNNASLVFKGKENTFDILGDPTEGSLLLLARDKGINLEEERQIGHLIKEFPFDSVNKTMSVVWQDKEESTALVKGAPERILQSCSHFLSGGKVVKLDEKRKEDLLKEVENEAKKGLRILGFADKKFSSFSDKVTREETEKELTFLGFASLADSPREEVKEALFLAKKAGIKVVMVTGDNEITALAIGREIGLFTENSEEIITGDQLRNLTNDELLSLLPKVAIFARTSPEDKIKIVTSFQEIGKVVAVTGDGVNDSPALRKADIGIAMGITGTDVAKEASDIIINDDNFASIVKAIEEGRVIYDNILKSVRYLVAGNGAELFTIVGCVALGMPSPLTPLQILWLNLVTDGLPALALASDPKDRAIMDRTPRNKNHSIFQTIGIKLILTVALSVSAIAIVVYFLASNWLNFAKGGSIVFTYLVISQMVVIFFLRRGTPFLSNRLLLGTTVTTIFLQGLILFLPPFQKLLEITPFW